VGNAGTNGALDPPPVNHLRTPPDSTTALNAESPAFNTLADSAVHLGTAEQFLAQREGDEQVAQTMAKLWSLNENFPALDEILLGDHHFNN
jgi:hypothetical protein